MQKRIVPLLVTMAVALLALLASGRSRSLAADEGGQSLEGSWAVIITPDSPPPGAPKQFLNLATFTPDGGFITSSGYISDSLGHGTWLRTGNRQFAVTCLGLSYGADGTTEYTWKIRATLVFTESGYELTGPFVADTIDATGKVVFSATGTTRLFHINVEKMP